MASFNKVILAGNLTRDPQMSYLPSQTPVCEFGLAVNRRWRGPNGEQREEVCFIDCRCYGKQAEVFAQYMTKGQPVLIEGRLQFDQWESQDGQKRSKHRVNVASFQFLGAPRTGQGQGPGAPHPPAPHAQPPHAAPSQAPQGQDTGPAPQDDFPPPQEPPTGEDIPF